MLQGTGSSVGKSLLVAGLCRLFARRGLVVRPFKPQNMSNNAAVAVEGGEIGRAQALQARACFAAPSVHMNPVLLKPQSETGSQVVVQGRVHAAVRAREYQAMKPTLLPRVLDSFARLRAEADLVVVEGAGSASEVNLRAGDIANMGFARAAGVPVVVVGDIDRGGVVASLVGTHAVLDPGDRALVAGFVVNRMRGDPSLFDDGMRFVAGRTGWAPLGLVPHLPEAAHLPAEDAADLLPGRRGAGWLHVVVPVLPWIANFDDLDPLLAEGEVSLTFVPGGNALPDCACVLLPGSKSTVADLRAFREEGWDIDLRAHLRRGGHVLGICGGMQMLGRRISDPLGMEGPAGTAVDGLGLLDAETVLTGEKRLLRLPGGAYEMHVGVTTGATESADGRVQGTYEHGLFADDERRAEWLASFGAGSGVRYGDQVEAALDTLAAHLERHAAGLVSLISATMARAASAGSGAAVMGRPTTR